MAALVDLVSRVRLDLGDMPKQFNYTSTGDGTNKDFDLKYKPVEPTTLLVTVNNVVKTTPTDYTLEKDLGIIHFVTAPANALAVKVTGTAYRYFSDSDIERFVNTAVEQHTFEINICLINSNGLKFHFYTLILNGNLSIYFFKKRYFHSKSW